MMGREPIWKKLARWLPAAGWYAVIWYLSAQTGSESQSMSNGLLEAMGHDIQDSPAVTTAFLALLVRKGAHMGAFFMLTGLVLFALWRPVKRPALRAGAALALCGLLASLDEFHQTFVPGRNGTPRDVLIDLLGGVCFLLLWMLIRAVRARRRADRPVQV